MFALIETFEKRRHCSAVKVTFDDGILRVTGTNANDHIELVALGGGGLSVVQVVGTPKADPYRNLLFVNGRVRLIRVFGRGGDDQLIVSPKLHIRASIEGGDGNDRIGGGGANDTLFGGRGNDTIAGSRGNDYLDAGAGDDYIEDTSGINVIHGGAGSDRAIQDSFHLRSGVEDPPITDRDTTYSTNVHTEQGRIILRYSGWLSSISDDSTPSGPTRLPNGQYAVKADQTYHGIGTILGSFDHRWDITDVAASGVVLTTTDLDKSLHGATRETVFSLPFLLPTRS